MFFFWRTLFSVWRDRAYRYLEDWSWLDSLHFSVITLTTIGNDDFSSQTDFGKLSNIAYITVGTALILSFANTLFFSYKKEMLKNISLKCKNNA